MSDFVISGEEMKDIIDLTEEMCETPGWIINIQPIANRRMAIINEIRSRPHTSTPDCVKCLEEDKITMLEHDTTIRKEERERVLDELLSYCRGAMESEGMLFEMQQVPIDDIEYAYAKLIKGESLRGEP